MKLKKPILFSILFLLIFVSAFSAGIYSSIQYSSKLTSGFSKNIELKKPDNLSVTEDLVFEETEDDGKEFSAELTLITDYFSFNSINYILDTNCSELLYIKKTDLAIYLSIRALRI